MNFWKEVLHFYMNWTILESLVETKTFEFAGSAGIRFTILFFWSAACMFNFNMKNS